MALPPGISTGAVTFGQAVSLIGGGDTTMTIEIKPTHNVVHAATGIQLLDFAETMTLAEGVPGSITLPHTDQTGFIDSSGNAFQGWAYVATGNWRRGSETRAFTKRFQILLGQNTIDLDLLPNGQITVPVTAPVMPVTSFLGLTGPIVEEDLEGLELGGVADGSVDEVKLDPAVVTKIDGKLDAVDAADFITETQADASYVPFERLAKNPELLITGALTRNANQAVTSAAVVWPDGTPGTFTAETLSTAFPGAVDGYRITYGSPATKTYTQPTITRNAAGAATAVPAIVVS